MKDHTHFDLVILGSGSTAFAASLRAQELGKTAVMTEERIVGGTCVNRGCLPSKNLIEAAKLIHDARNPRYPGLTPAEVKLNFKELIAQKDEVIHGYRKKNMRAWSTGKSASRKATSSLSISTPCRSTTSGLRVKIFSSLLARGRSFQTSKGCGMCPF